MHDRGELALRVGVNLAQPGAELADLLLQLGDLRAVADIGEPQELADEHGDGGKEMRRGSTQVLAPGDELLVVPVAHLPVEVGELVNGHAVQERRQASGRSGCAFTTWAKRSGWMKTNRRPPGRSMASATTLSSSTKPGRNERRIRASDATSRKVPSALRRELGANGEILDALPAKATGRPGVNVGIAWKFFTSSIYASGDLPVLAVRELLQNSKDSIAAAIRLRQLRQEDARFEVTSDRATHTLTADDNGQGMDERTILDKFLVIGESGKRGAGDSGEAAGGFGVAKAVILGTASLFRWEIATRDNLAVSNGEGGDVEVFDAPFRPGCRIVLHDGSDEFDSVWDRARQSYIAIEDRLRELLAANDLPGIRLVFNGVEVKPMFSRRGGSRIALDASWGNGVTAGIRAYRRAPGDKGGSYYVRLDGLAQFRVPSSRGGLKVDRGRVTPDVFRHTTAVHLLEAGVEVNVIRGWLGHASLASTNRYAEINAKAKEKALKACEPPSSGNVDEPSWRKNEDVLAWLAGL